MRFMGDLGEEKRRVYHYARRLPKAERRMKFSSMKGIAIFSRLVA